MKGYFLIISRFGKISNFFSTSYFLVQLHLDFVDMKYFSCATPTWHETLFRATSTYFCRIAFCETNFFVTQTRFFSVTLHFYFGHSLECYVMVTYNLLLRSNMWHFYIQRHFHIQIFRDIFISHFMPVISFDTPWKH